MSEETTHSEKPAFAFNDQALVFRIKFGPRHIQRNAGLSRKALQLRSKSAIFWLGPRLNCTLGKSFRLIRNDQVHVKIYGVPESLTAWAGAVWVIKRK